MKLSRIDVLLSRVNSLLENIPVQLIEESAPVRASVEFAQDYAQVQAELRAVRREIATAGLYLANSFGNEKLTHTSSRGLAKLQDAAFPNESAVKIRNGNSIRMPAFPEECSYVRVINPFGEEVAYWISDEWKDDPQEVMGAILGAAMGAAPDDIHVVVVEQDGGPPETAKPIVFETYCHKATREDAESKIESLNGRYGAARIGRIVFDD